ncbi:arabinose metabolism transcriptional repressor [Abditibacteriota bacterium]|nr:arabinose metabolism transcriptional repressor [Abditibacteriota bacterium]
MFSAPETDSPTRTRKGKIGARQVLQVLEEMCASLAPGTRLPTRSELMRSLDASERTIMNALDELRRSGRIVVRNGAGTFVAAPQSRGLRRHDKTVVAIASPDHSFYDRALEVLLERSENAGLSLLCRPFDSRMDTNIFLEEAMGYLLFGRFLAPLATQLHSKGKRVVLVATPAANEVFAVPSVCGDQKKGGYLVARHLIELGHRHIAVAGSENFDMRSPRGMGIEKAAHEARQTCPSLQITLIEPEQMRMWKQNVDAARDFWRGRDAPSAVAVWNDHQALLLMNFLTYIGVRIPEQASIVGYDNLPISEQCHPTLTTIDGALESQLQAALDLLVQEQPLNPHQSVVVLPSLICRDSSGPRQPMT